MLYSTIRNEREQGPDGHENYLRALKAAQKFLHLLLHQ